MLCLTYGNLGQVLWRVPPAYQLTEFYAGTRIFAYRSPYRGRDHPDHRRDRVPSYLHSKMAANESSAVYSIRTIDTAQVTYATTYPSLGYASALNMLAAPTGGGTVSSANAGILDWVLGCLTILPEERIPIRDRARHSSTDGSSTVTACGDYRRAWG